MFGRRPRFSNFNNCYNPWTSLYWHLKHSESIKNENKDGKALWDLIIGFSLIGLKYQPPKEFFLQAESSFRMMRCNSLKNSSFS